MYVYVKVMKLSAGESQNGCVSTGGSVISCKGERRYDEPLRLHVAASDCHSVHGLQLDYELDVYGVTNADELCSAAPLPTPPAVSACLAVYVVVSLTSSGALPLST